MVAMNSGSAMPVSTATEGRQHEYRLRQPPAVGSSAEAAITATATSTAAGTVSR